MQEVQKTKQSSVDLSKMVAQSTGLLAIKLSSNCHSKSMLIYWYTFICSGDDQDLIE